MERRRGAAALELAVIMPFLAFVIAAALDYARVYRASQSLEAIASAGAATASGTHWVPNATQTNADAAKAQMISEGSSLDPPLQASQVAVTSDNGRVVVIVEYNVPLILGVLYTDNTAALRRTARYNLAPRPGD